MKFLSLLLLFLLTACASDDMASNAPPGNRRVNIVNKATGEKAFVTYVRNGRYDGDAMQKISRLFRDQVTGEVHRIDPKLVDVIYSLLNALALPDDTEITVTSGYRTPARQAEMSQKDENAARKSLHTTGQAADIKIRGVSGKAVAEVAKTLQDGGVAYYPKTGHIHVDVGRIRTWYPK
jgi:uncharacterized protein YcbK (DUF882 family)